MKEILFVVCVVAVTAYLAVTAWEDHKTCEITRWKHLIGFLPAITWFCMNENMGSLLDCAIILAFSVLYIAIGYMGVYGAADGFVFSNLVIFFGGIGGVIGIGIVVLIMIIAGFSFLISHIAKCIIKRKKLFHNAASAFVPHIFVGYVSVGLGILFRVVV